MRATYLAAAASAYTQVDDHTLEALPMPMYELWLLLHILSVLVLAAAVGSSITCKIAALRTPSPLVVITLMRTAAASVRSVGMPASLVLLIAGGALVHESHGAWSMGEPWIVGAFLLWVASGFVGALMHAPRSRKVRMLAQQLIESSSDATDELRGLIRGGMSASILDTLLLMGMVALMVFKPGA